MKLFVLSVLLCLGAIALNSNGDTIVFNANGDCNNTVDLAAFKTHYDDFHSVLETCAKQTMGQAEKTAQCLMKATGNTHDCALCFGNDAHCSEVHCLKECLADPSAPACLNCVQKNCYPALVACAKVDNSTIPP